MTTGLAFVALAAIWGSSFLFIRIAAPEFGAILSAELRVAIAWGLFMARFFFYPRASPVF
ncbi:MAG: hypothetical protein VW440_00050 [Bordetella sp.]